jgi:hypothetical protein
MVMLIKEQEDEVKVFFFLPLEERKTPSATADATGDDQGTEAGTIKLNYHLHEITSLIPLAVILIFAAIYNYNEPNLF